MPSGTPPRHVFPHVATILLLVVVDAVQTGRPYNERHLRPVRRSRPLPFLRRHGGGGGHRRRLWLERAAIARVYVRMRLPQVRILSRAIGKEAASPVAILVVLVGRRRRRGVVVVSRRGGRRAAVLGVRNLRPQDVRVRSPTTTGEEQR
jgi:hypothetical protein